MKFVGIKTIQDIETKILEKIHYVCNKNGIQYFTLFGSALGGARHNGPIPWDSDADVGIFAKDINKFLECWIKEDYEEFYISFFKFDKRNCSSHPEIFAKGIDGRVCHVDIFPIIKVPTNDELRINYLIEVNEFILNLKYSRFSFIGNHGDYGLKITCKRVLHFFKCLGYKLKHKKVDLIKEFELLLNKFDNEESDMFSHFYVGAYKMPAVCLNIYGNGLEKEYSGKYFIFPEKLDAYLELHYKKWNEYPSKKERDIGYASKALINKDFYKYFKEIKE